MVNRTDNDSTNQAAAATDSSPAGDNVKRNRPSLHEWLDLRTGYWGFVRKNLDEPMPAGVGWWQTLGNLLMTLLAFQFITGFALTLYYAPTPDHAYGSVKHITDEVTFGSVIRGVHHWGATLIIIAMMLHTLRVFFMGSYKKPRELTWIMGVFIFQVLLAFSFTGYLLPWDQRAYWATVVGTRMMNTVPLIGNTLMEFVRGSQEVGALTLTRFYAVHIMLLPAVLIGLTAFHLYLIRRLHTSGPLIKQKGPGVPFFPTQLYRDALVVVGATLILFALAIRVEPELTGMANPAHADFPPRPEWYFLGLYEFLKYMPPQMLVVGTIIVPNIVTLAMIFLPWLDRSSSRLPSQRRWIIDTGLALFLFIGLLTLKGLLSEAPTAASVSAPHDTRSTVPATIGR